MRWLAVFVALALLLGEAAPQAPAGGGQGWGNPVAAVAGVFRSLFTGAAWARTPTPPTPVQSRGTADGRSHAVSAGATRSGRGTGRPAGTAAGQLPLYRAQASPTKPSVTGRAIGDGSHSFNPATSSRVAALSTSTSDMYRNADGTYTRKVFGTPVNFRDSSGVWTPIDTTLAARGDGRWYERSSGEPASFARLASDPQVVSLNLGSDRSVGYGLSGAAPVPAQVSGSTARYLGVLPDTDLVVSTVGDGVKESLSLSSPQAPTSFVFPLRLAGVSARTAADGSIEFVDGSGEVVGRIPSGYMQDSAAAPATGGAAVSHGVRYTLVHTGGVPAVEMTLDGAWLRDPARRFPVTVDPSVNAAGSGSTYTLSDVPNVDRSGEYQMIVGTWNNGGQVGVSDVAFANLGTSLAGDRVSSASLSVFCIWAASSTPTPFYVAPITVPWSVSGAKSYPGPAYGGAIGSLSVDPGYWPRNNTGGDQTLGTWMSVPLSVDTFNSWTTGGANNGLALYADGTGSASWKRFDSVNSVNPPYLTLNYTQDAAPQIDSQAPYSGYNAPTLRPELIATGHDADGWPGTALKYGFTVYTTSGATVVDSGWLSTGDWVVPAGTVREKRPGDNKSRVHV